MFAGRLHIINRKLHNIPNIERNIIIFTDALKSHNLTEAQRIDYERNLISQQKELELANGPIAVEYFAPSEMLNSYLEKKATFRFFGAYRKAEINSVSSATASQPDIDSVNINTPLGRSLEQHLVNLKVRTALAAQTGEISPRTIHAEEWIASLSKNLKYLFEDQSTELVFSPDKLRFYISQNGKPPYGFQDLSSGYLAIFDIYADLLMHTEYTNIPPSELTGIIIIDEIDAHLHVSLQRKILPFLTDSFPSIQYIVTTHSPFVLTSVDNAVIFDVSTCQILTDLSMYSYESVAEGLLGVPPISKIFEDTIKKLTNITSQDNFDLNKAELLLKTITPFVDVLDAESEMFYQLAANKIIKMKTENK